MRVVVALFCAIVVFGLLLGAPLYQHRTDVSGLAPADEIAIAVRMADDVRLHRFDDATALMEEKARPTDPTLLPRIAGLFPAERWAHMRATLWTRAISTTDSFDHLEMLFEYRNDSALSLTLTMVRTPKGPVIRAANFNYLRRQDLHANDFELPASAKDSRWIALCLGGTIDLFAFVTFVVCMTSPLIRWRWRWLWLIIVLVGVMRFNVNWSTGALATLPISFMLPPASLGRIGIFGPWFVMLTAPLGAAAYWAYRTRWSHEAVTVRPAGDLRMG